MALRVKLDDIIEGLEFQSDESSSFLDKTTGNVVLISDYEMLAAKEGIFVGMSSGAAVAGALHIAEKMTSGTIVVILPDRGDRYLSTTLFRSICAKCPP